MYEQLKNDMREAGIPVSEGNDLAQSDLQLVRDYFYFAGITLNGDDFLAYVSPNNTDGPMSPEDDSAGTVGDETTETVEGQESSVSEESSAPEAPVMEESPEVGVEDTNEDTEHNEQADDNNEGVE